MSSVVSLPVNRPVGRALIVGNPAGRSGALEVLQRLGYGCAEADDPYAAMAELCRRPQAYQALILSLQTVFREELQVIAAIRRRLPEVEIWLTETDGRQAVMVEAMGLGADGLLSDEGLHRIAFQPSAGAESAAGGSPAAAPPQGASPRTAEVPAKLTAAAATVQSAAGAAPYAAEDDDDATGGDAVLTADELRALLHDDTSPLDED